jgi:hypothetical protein
VIDARVDELRDGSWSALKRRRFRRECHRRAATGPAISVHGDDPLPGCDETTVRRAQAHGAAQYGSSGIRERARYGSSRIGGEHPQ